MTNLLVSVALAAAALWGCTTPATAPGPIPAPSAVQAPAAAHYRCDEGSEFTIRFAEDSATMDAGPRGGEMLLRDAGGVTPQQTVYSNLRMRAEFGLGVSGREAILRYAEAASVVRCVRD